MSRNLLPRHYVLAGTIVLCVVEAGLGYLELNDGTPSYFLLAVMAFVFIVSSFAIAAAYKFRWATRGEYPSGVPQGEIEMSRQELDDLKKDIDERKDMLVKTIAESVSSSPGKKHQVARIVAELSSGLRDRIPDDKSAADLEIIMALKTAYIELGEAIRNIEALATKRDYEPVKSHASISGRDIAEALKDTDGLDIRGFKGGE